MKIVLHIGMGKTGTSAIQRALADNAAALRAQGVAYIGMWFDMLDPRFKGLRHQQEFFALPAAAMRDGADQLYRILAERAAAEGLTTFLWSNEAFSGKARQMGPLVARLTALGAEVQLIAWVRNPQAWLPSAYVQWGLRHKVEPGPVQPFGVKARKLVRWYGGLVDWHKAAGAALKIRSYDRAPEIVADLAQALGLDLPNPGQRVLERGEPAEVVLRALFNDRIEGSALPGLFDEALRPGLGEIPQIEDVAAQCFDYSETAQIIAEQAALFDRLTEICGFDPRLEPSRPATALDAQALRARMLDVLVAIVIDQAARIQRLEAAQCAPDPARPRRKRLT